MLTRLRLQPFQPYGDWRADAPRLAQWIQDYWLSLENQGALSLEGANITASNGIKFPATQNAQTDVNTLDDYEEGPSTLSWTPSLSFATPGNLSFNYTAQVGTYIKVGRLVLAWFNIITDTLTHTTASGDLIVSGLPFTVRNIASGWGGSLSVQGITKANYTNFSAVAVENTTQVKIYASGSGQGIDTIDAGDVPTGGTVWLRGMVAYLQE